MIAHPCGECGGSGRIVEERTLEVEVPPGIHDGQQIRLTGEGHAGSLGGRAGDLYVQVRIRPDPRFVREGNDIITTVDLTITQAALGATLPVPTLEGETELELEPGTQPGSVVVLRGRGMPVLQGFGRGDQRVLVNVRVPQRLTDDQRALLERLQDVARRRTLRRRRGVLREAEERVPLSTLRRVATTVSPERAEIARALMVELFPEGFEETEHSDGVELAAYTDASGEERLWAAFGTVSADAVPDGWEQRWREFHKPVRVGRLWLGPPWEDPPADALAVVIDPGRAFGTGGHPTTRLCLELLAEVEPASLSTRAAVPASSPSPRRSSASRRCARSTRRRPQSRQPCETQRRTASSSRSSRPTCCRPRCPRPKSSWRTSRRAFAGALRPQPATHTVLTSGYLESDRPTIDRFRPLERRIAQGWAADLHRREE